MGLPEFCEPSEIRQRRMHWYRMAVKLYTTFNKWPRCRHDIITVDTTWMHEISHVMPYHLEILRERHGGLIGPTEMERLYNRMFGEEDEHVGSTQHRKSKVRKAKQR